MSSRAALESAIQELGPGAPPHTSLSHGRELSVGAACRGRRVGVDLCEWERGPLLRLLAPRFLPKEAACGEQWSDRDWVKAWAMKEAGLKALGLGLGTGGILDGKDPHGLGIHLGAHGGYERDDLRCQVLELPEGAVAVAYEARASDNRLGSPRLDVKLERRPP